MQPIEMVTQDFVYKKYFDGFKIDAKTFIKFKRSAVKQKLAIYEDSNIQIGIKNERADTDSKHTQKYCLQYLNRGKAPIEQLQTRLTASECNLAGAQKF